MRGFMRGFGNRIIAHARRRRAYIRAGDRVALLTFTALDAAQNDRKEA